MRSRVLSGLVRGVLRSPFSHFCKPVRTGRYLFHFYGRNAVSRAFACRGPGTARLGQQQPAAASQHCLGQPPSVCALLRACSAVGVFSLLCLPQLYSRGGDNTHTRADMHSTCTDKLRATGKVLNALARPAPSAAVCGEISAVWGVVYRGGSWMNATDTQTRGTVQSCENRTFVDRASRSPHTVSGVRGVIDRCRTGGVTTKRAFVHEGIRLCERMVAVTINLALILCALNK